MAPRKPLQRFASTSFAIAICLLSATVVAQSNDMPATVPSETPEQMSKDIEALKLRLAQLEQRQTQLMHEREVQQTVTAVREDATERSRGISSGEFTAGYKDRRFTLQTSDGAFVLRPWLHLQLRHSTNFREGGSSVAHEDTQDGFEIRRARFGFDGNLLTKDLQYSFDWATYRGNSGGSINNADGTTTSFQHLNGGTPVLEEAWVLYHFSDSPWSIRAGQMHDPLDHEAIVGSKYRAPEVSLQGDIFANTDTFTQAVTVIYDPKSNFRFEGGFTDGERAANTNFVDYPNNGVQYDWGVAGRGEYKFFGDWKEYNQLTAHGDKEDLLVAGLGVDNSQRSSSNSLSHTLDLQYAGKSGLFLYGSYFGRYTSNNPGIYSGAPVSTSVGNFADAGRDTYEYSFLGQAAYSIDQHWEPYVRYEFLRLAGTPTGSDNSVHEFSIGVNYYFYDHNVKLTTQMMYLPNGIPINDDSNDVLINNGKQELIVMEQLQFLL